MISLPSVLASTLWVKYQKSMWPGTLLLCDHASADFLHFTVDRLDWTCKVAIITVCVLCVCLCVSYNYDWWYSNDSLPISTHSEAVISRWQTNDKISRFCGPILSDDKKSADFCMSLDRFYRSILSADISAINLAVEFVLISPRKSAGILLFVFHGLYTGGCPYFHDIPHEFFSVCSLKDR